MIQFFWKKLFSSLCLGVCAIVLMVLGMVDQMGEDFYFNHVAILVTDPRFLMCTAVAAICAVCAIAVWFTPDYEWEEYY